MKTILYINTGDTNKPSITLKTDAHEWVHDLNKNQKSSQTILLGIQQSLEEHDLQTSDLTTIELFTGPGSYTGLRVGAAIASTISLLLNIPINHLPPGSVPVIEYGKDLWGLNES